MNLLKRSEILVHARNPVKNSCLFVPRFFDTTEEGLQVAEEFAQDWERYGSQNPGMPGKFRGHETEHLRLDPDLLAGKAPDSCLFVREGQDGKVTPVYRPGGVMSPDRYLSILNVTNPSAGDIVLTRWAMNEKIMEYMADTGHELR